MRSETRFAIRDEDTLQVSWNRKSKTFIDFYISLISSWSNKIDTPQPPFDIAKQLWLIADILLKTKYHPSTDILRDYQLSKSMSLLQISNGSHKFTSGIRPMSNL